MFNNLKLAYFQLYTNLNFLKYLKFTHEIIRILNFKLQLFQYINSQALIQHIYQRTFPSNSMNSNKKLQQTSSLYCKGKLKDDTVESSSNFIKLNSLKRQINIYTHHLKQQQFVNQFKQSLFQVLREQKKRVSQSSFLNGQLPTKSKKQRKDCQTYNEVQNDINTIFFEHKKQMNSEKDNSILSLTQQSSSLHRQENIEKGDNNSKECSQSKHIQQVLIKPQTCNYQERMSLLRAKRNKLYEKIQDSLKQQEPYIHDKIISRIKKLAQYKSNVVLNQTIEASIKQKSKWIDQQKLKMEKDLYLKELNHVCMENLQKMKNLINKKIFTNDFIYQHYSNDQNSGNHQNISAEKKENGKSKQKKEVIENSILQIEYQNLLQEIHKKSIESQLTSRKFGKDSNQEYNQLQFLLKRYQRLFENEAQTETHKNQKKEKYNSSSYLQSRQTTITKRLELLNAQINSLSESN